MGSRRSFALLTGLIMLAAMVPVMATTTTSAEGATATTAAGGATATSGAEATTTTAEPIVPAVSVEVTQPLEAQPDWTYRYFIPTLLVLAALVVVVTVVQYFVRVVRNRYRVVR